MVILVFQVGTITAMGNLRHSLANILPDTNEDTKILCVVGDDELYPRVRNIIDDAMSDLPPKPSGYIEHLTVLAASKHGMFNEAKDYIEPGISASTRVFVSNCSVVLPMGSVTKLLYDYYLFPNAGMITGLFDEFPQPCWLENVYSNNSPTVKWDERKTNPGLVEIDTYLPYGIVMRLEEFRDTDFSYDGEYKGLFPGVRLRRLGYKNYLDTTIRYKYGE